MLQTSQIKNGSGVNEDWSHRLFHQTTGIQQELGPRSKRSPDSSSSKRPLALRRRNLHWSEQIFASATSGLVPRNKLVVTLGRKAIFEFELCANQFEVYLGSHQKADVELEGTKVAPFHAKVFCRNGQFQLEDLGSERGTYLDGKKVTPGEPAGLHDGASVRIMAYQIHLDLHENQRVVAHSDNRSKLQKEEPRCYPLQLRSGLVEDKTIGAASSKLRTVSQSIDQWSKKNTELVVADVIDETYGVKTFRLVGKTPLSFSYQAGQFLTLLLEIEGEKVQRSYSMSSSPSRPHTLDITVKRVPGGLVSNWLCDRVKAGDRLMVKGPAGRFSLVSNETKKLLFIGAGSGSTPLMSMTRWLFDTACGIDVKALFSFRSRDDVIFGKEFELMRDSSKAVDIAVTLTGEGVNTTNRHRFSGRIDSAMLEAFVTDLHERDVFLCGPEAFMKDVKSILEALNFPMNRLNTESFGDSQSSPKIPSQIQSVERNIENTCRPDAAKTNGEVIHAITFAKSNKVVQVNENTNLLAAAEAEGIEIDYSCRTGSCAECMVKCLSGRAEMDEECEIDEHERERGWIFSCCAFASTDLTIDA